MMMSHVYAQTVKDTIMKSFFDEEYLRSYVTGKVKELDIDKRINDMMASPKTEKVRRVGFFNILHIVILW